MGKSETGHGINISNFGHLIDVVSSYSKYSPSNPDLIIANMKAKLDEAKLLENALTGAGGREKTDGSDRKDLFKSINKLMTRILNHYCSLKVSLRMKGKAKKMVAVIRGDNVRKKKSKDGKPIPNQKSKSHLGFINRIYNISKLIAWLEIQPVYSPNENDLKVSSLKTFVTTLTNSVDDVNKLSIDTGTKRAMRNVCLYKVGPGVIDIALACKKYVRSVYGARSQQALEVGKIKFRRFMKL